MSCVWINHFLGVCAVPMWLQKNEFNSKKLQLWTLTQQAHYRIQRLVPKEVTWETGQ